MKTPLFSKTGSKSQATIELPKSIFEAPIKNHELLAQASRAYLADSRQAGAKTLKRGEVRGGGKKPWRQKGTGRARAGSTRSPLWRGGGVTFGPTGQENHAVQLTKKAKRTAVRQALSLKAKAGVLLTIEDLVLKTPKTKEAADLLKKLGLSRRILLVVDAKTDPLIRSTRNLANVQVLSAKYLNVVDILSADHILVTKPALGQISVWLGDKTAPKPETVSTKPPAKKIGKAS